MMKRTSILAVTMFAAAACADQPQTAPPPAVIPFNKTAAPHAATTMAPAMPAALKPAVTSAPTTMPAAATALGPSSSVDEILDALDVRGQSLTGFTADIQTSDQDLTFGGDPTIRPGNIWYQTDATGTKLHLIFSKKILGKRTTPDKLEYLLDDVWLTDRDYNAKVEMKRQIAKVGDKINLFQLGKGPFPLPIGQKKADVLKAFEVTKKAPAADDPAGTIHLLLKPKPNTQMADSFSTIEVWIDPANQFPARIETVDKRGAIDKTTDFKNVTVNTAIKPADLTVGNIDATWKTTNVPLAQ